MDVNSIVNGSISGTRVGSRYTKNLKIMIKSKSLPANSFTKSHTDCSINMKIRIAKTLKNVFKNVVKIYRSSIFKISYSLM